MSGSTRGCPRLNGGSRGDEIMFTEHLPILRDLSPPDPVLSWGVLATFLQPGTGAKSLGGRSLAVLLPIVVQGV